jgi:NAD(P)-dependent dehydrogenase (short-subunit alcohol dehydrogenase family)
MAKKIALVTGANKGIGKEVARQLGKAGMTVYVGARDLKRGQAAADELKADGVDVAVVQLDVTNDDSVKGAVATIEKQHGKLDVLVNNAGIADMAAAGLSEPLESVRTTFDTNFFGAARVLQAAVPLLKKSDAPRIVNVSSTLGSLNKNSDTNWDFYNVKFLGYNASKAALNMLTVIAAAELRDANAKVNSICPGYVATDINNNQGHRTVEQGAAIVVKMATLSADGPTGGYWDDAGKIEW